MGRYESEIRDLHRKMALPVLAILALGIATVGALIFIATTGQDRNAAERSLALAKSVVSTTRENMHSVTLDTGYWDQAVENLVTNFDPDWAEEEIGAYIAEYYGMSSSYVLDAADQTVFAFVDGEVSDTAATARFGGDLPNLLRGARAAMPEAAPDTAAEESPAAVGDPPPIAISGFISDGEQVHIASMVVLTTYHEVDGVAVDERSDHVLMFTRRLDEDFLSDIADKYLLEGLRLVPAPPDSVAYLTLVSAGGDNLGYLTWRQLRPGADILPVLAAGVAAVALAVLVAVVVFLKRSQAFAARLAQETVGHEEASSLLRSTLDAVDQGIVSWDSRGRLLTWNQTCLEYWGINEGLVVGAARDDLVTRAGQIVVAGDGQKVSLGDGRLVAVSHFPMSDGGRTVVYTDITEREQFQSELMLAKLSAEEANAAKSRFIANISHELRTPLNAILGFSDLLLNKGHTIRSEEMRQDYVQSIHQAGETLLYNIDQILDLSKIEAGKIKLDPTEMDVAEAVNNATQLVSAQCRLKQQTLTVEGPKGALILLADRMAITQVVTNLLSNAVKFTPERGEIKVAYGERDDETYISVTDNGVGIAPDVIDTIMDPFVQVGDHSPDGGKGTGLGLSIARSLVKLHGGTLSVKSTLGEGSTFTASIPKERQANAA